MCICMAILSYYSTEFIDYFATVFVYKNNITVIINMTFSYFIKSDMIHMELFLLEFGLLPLK